VVKDFVNDDGSRLARCNYSSGRCSCHANVRSLKWHMLQEYSRLGR
jgi:hypothetical protein